MSQIMLSNMRTVGKVLMWTQFENSCATPYLNFRVNWSTSELNTQVNPTTSLGDTDCWIQQVTAPTLVVTCWIQQGVCILPSTCTARGKPPLSD